MNYENRYKIIKEKKNDFEVIETDGLKYILANWKKHIKMLHTLWFWLCDILEKAKLFRPESDKWLPRAERWREETSIQGGTQEFLEQWTVP